MNRKILILIIFTVIACQKDDEWIQIDSIKTEESLNKHLDSIFTAQNNCLINFEEDKLFHIVHDFNDFEDIDTCHSISGIDFKNYTLVVGKIQVSSISDKLGAINLCLKNDKYKIEVAVDRCTECYAAIGYLYFWKLYPKLNFHYSSELIVN